MTTLSRIRRVIAEIPRGKVATYGQVAARAGFPGAARMSVWALQRSDGLPWHRVVSAGGRIALPGEEGREQHLRLELEGVTFRGGRVRLDLHAWTPGVARARTRPRGRGPTVRRRPANAPPRASSRVASNAAVEGFGPRPKPFRHGPVPESSDER